MAEEQTIYADLILPVPVPGLFTYAVPPEFMSAIAPGQRAIVPFGPKKLYSGLVKRLHHDKPEGFQLKSIIELVDSNALVNQKQLQLWDWMAGYYMATTGDIMKAALPTGMKLESESRVSLTGKEKEVKLNDKEMQIMTALGNKKTMRVDEINKLLEQKSAMGHINSLLGKGLITLEQGMAKSYRPRTETLVGLAEEYRSEYRQHEALDKLKRAPKQQELLEWIIGNNPYEKIEKKALLEASGASAATLKALIEKGMLSTREKKVWRALPPDIETQEAHPLNPAQSKAMQEIRNCFAEKPVCLLHGVTSSGKTEIYIHLIREQLEKGKQVLYLLPEIALTAQIITRLTRIFGRKVGVYHSRYSDAERVEIWKRLQDTGSPHKLQLILAARSGVFLPFSELGLVIVDEEHENSYKQYDPAPRYHARDTAISLGIMHKAPVLLGTATPSLESYYNATTGKYGLVELKQRYLDIQLPEVNVANLSLARKRKEMQSHFTPMLLRQMEACMEAGEQIILFQNRRGFSPFTECMECGWVPACPHCDVSLTYHKHRRELNCHYCGYSMTMPGACKACGGTDMRTRGFGTEQVEEELNLLFPKARIGRLDLDSARGKEAYARIISDFEHGRTNILVGTQMVSKGLDFDRVKLVGVLNADNLLNFPDFRAHERSFQLMAQVSGRAGRKGKRGLVIIQTSDPENPVIKQVTAHNFEAMYRVQMQERKAFHYPPFTRIIRLQYKHKQKSTCDRAAIQAAAMLRKLFGKRILGPGEPPVQKVQDYFIMQIIIKIERKANLDRAKELIAKVNEYLSSDNRNKNIMIVADVDPY